jgi:hypothetical protein
MKNILKAVTIFTVFALANLTVVLAGPGGSILGG